MTSERMTWCRRSVLLVFAGALAGCGGAGDGGQGAASAALLEEAAAAQVSAAGLSPVCSGSPQTITGVVKSANVPGEGLTLDTGSGSVTFFGLGPAWYWAQAGIPRPVVGDTLTVALTRVSTTLNTVALAITVRGQDLVLRDEATCLPLWRSAGTSGDGSGAGAARGAAQPVLCDGTQLSFSGTVTGVGVPDGGLTLTSSTGTQTFFGLGPVWYWNAQGVSRPVVGDRLSIVASRVISSDALVLLRVERDGVALDLRDAGSCVPLW